MGSYKEELRLTRQRVADITERLYNKHTVASSQHLRLGDKENRKTRPKTANSVASYADWEIEEVVKRLSKCKKEVTDSRRVGSNNKGGIVNTYAWRGWNSELPHIYWRYNYPRNYLRSGSA